VSQSRSELGRIEILRISAQSGLAKTQTSSF